MEIHVRCHRCHSRSVLLKLWAGFEHLGRSLNECECCRKPTPTLRWHTLSLKVRKLTVTSRKQNNYNLQQLVVIISNSLEAVHKPEKLIVSLWVHMFNKAMQWGHLWSQCGRIKLNTVQENAIMLMCQLHNISIFFLFYFFYSYHVCFVLKKIWNCSSRKVNVEVI